MRRRRNFKLDTKLIVDVTSASLLVSNIPKLIDMVLPLDPIMRKVAAVGATYFVGTMAKRPNISQAGIAVGITELIEPFIDQLLGGIKPELFAGGVPIPQGGQGIVTTEPASLNVADYINLNEYVSTPGSMGVNAYKDS